MAERLFEVGTAGRPGPTPRYRPTDGRVVRVVVDVGAITRPFDYLVPTRWADRVRVGTIVRVPLHGRRVRAWVVELDPATPAGLRLEQVTKVTGEGPPADVIELCRWATWRWAGRLPQFLGAASPEHVVASVGARPPRRSVPTPPPPTGWPTEPASAPRSTLRLPPAEDPGPLLVSLASRGDLLVVCPTAVEVDTALQSLRSGGVRAVGYPDGWAAAAAGTTVVGTRRAILAPMPDLAAIVVLDEHDEALQAEGSPTWHVRELAFERGRRRGVPVVLTSPCPTLEARRRAPVVELARTREREGWARLEVVDRRDEDLARAGLFSAAVVRALTDRSAGRALCVLNRTGRAALVACGACRSVADCESCGASVVLDDDRRLRCRQCGTVRPMVCRRCGATSMRQLRVGVTRVREDLEALLREPVAEITGSGRQGPGSARVVVGTEAVLHQVGSAASVVFLELDQELLAPRYRAAEQALALLARASRVVGGRRGRVLVQTRHPEHVVIRAALLAEPDLVADGELARRELLELPPAVPVAVVGGAAGDAYVEALRSNEAAGALRFDRGPSGDWLVRAPERGSLLDALAATPRPPGRLRLWVDPARLPT